MQRTSGGAPEPAARIGDLRPGRVLHVEEDTFVAALVEATLGDAGIEVHWFSTGQAALAAAQTSEYDAYLLDVRLRDISGFRLAKELAGLDSRVPIVLITGGRENLPTYANLTVLTRPFAPRALVGAVAAALDARQEAA